MGTDRRGRVRTPTGGGEPLSTNVEAKRADTFEMTVVISPTDQAHHIEELLTRLFDSVRKELTESLLPAESVRWITVTAKSSGYLK